MANHFLVVREVQSMKHLILTFLLTSIEIIEADRRVGRKNFKLKYFL
jgi:hypothetical protein